MIKRNNDVVTYRMRKTEQALLERTETGVANISKKIREARLRTRQMDVIEHQKMGRSKPRWSDVL